jgi:hypothetical protein
MERNNKPSDEDLLLSEATRKQLAYFRVADPRCRALQLPEGIMLRYTMSEALYFYLQTGVSEGKIRTRVYATDSPYDRKKTNIGEVTTPMFEPAADQQQLAKLEDLLRAWVSFVREDAEGDPPFTSFPVHDHPE